MREPTVDEFNGNAVEYYAAVAKYFKYMKEELETYKKIKAAADAIILPAIDILPDTYDVEIRAYLKLRL